MFSFIARHKVASALVFLNVVAVLVVILVIVFHNAKTATIDIYVAPSEAAIELNGKKYDNFQQYDIMPGDYHVKVSMEGMETKEFDFEIFDGEFKRVRMYLLDADGGFGYYLENPDEILSLAEVVDNEDGNAVPGSSEEQIKLVREFATNYLKKEEAEQNLPINYTTDQADNGFGFISIDISLGSEDDCQNEAGSCIVVYDATGGNYDMAIKMVQENGIDVDDYEIVYRTGAERERAY